MMMRYHWGYGVGHTYAHRSQNPPMAWEPQTQKEMTSSSEDIQVDIIRASFPENSPSLPY